MVESNLNTAAVNLSCFKAVGVGGIIIYVFQGLFFEIGPKPGL